MAPRPFRRQACAFPIVAYCRKTAAAASSARAAALGMIIALVVETMS